MSDRNFVGKFFLSLYWMKNFFSVGFTTRCKATSTLNCTNWVTWVLAYVDHSSTIFWHSVVGQVTTLPQFNGMNLTKWSSNGTFVATSPNRIAIVIVNAIHFRHYVGVFSCFAYFYIYSIHSNICSFSVSSFFADNFTHSTCSGLDYKLNRVAQ